MIPFADIGTASNSQLGTWVVIMFAAASGVSSIIAIFSMFATRREVDRIDTRVTKLEDVDTIIRAEMNKMKDELFYSAERRSAVLHNRLNPVVENLAQLKGAQDSAQTQMDAFLSILHVDPAQLSSFLDDSDVAFKMINATLRDPARDSATFRRKIDGLFRQIHSIKGKAAAFFAKSMEAGAKAPAK